MNVNFGNTGEDVEGPTGREKDSGDIWVGNAQGQGERVTKTSQPAERSIIWREGKVHQIDGRCIYLFL